MTAIDAIGYLASTLVFATFCMRTMIPLRVVAIASNICFVAYGLLDHVYPVLLLHLVLLPMNGWRTFEMIRLVRRVEAAAKGDLSVDWLKPLMRPAHFEADHVLFRRGDVGDRLYYILRGEVLVEEVECLLREGELFGEVALFTASGQRTQTVRCLSDVELLWMTEQNLAQICYQNPAVSFHLLRLIANRLVGNMTRFESRAAVCPTTKST
jgi:CRP/FNR family transcriptional regulator, cyclic AMP receptor protein